MEVPPEVIESSPTVPEPHDAAVEQPELPVEEREQLLGELRLPVGEMPGDFQFQEIMSELAQLSRRLGEGDAELERDPQATARSIKRAVELLEKLRHTPRGGKLAALEETGSAVELP